MSDTTKGAFDPTEAEAAEIEEMEREAEAAKAEAEKPEETPEAKAEPETPEKPVEAAAEPETPEAKADEPEAAAEPEAKADEAEEEASPLDARFVPRFQGEIKDFTEDREAVQSELTEAQTARDEALAKIRENVESGDLTAEEASEQREAVREAFYDAKDQVRDKLSAIQLEETKQKTQLEIYEAAAEQSWSDAQEVFYAQNPDFREKAALKGALAAELEALYADEATKNWSDIRFLNKAKERVDAAFGRAPEAKPEAEKPAAEKPPARKPNVKDIPTTLGTVPAASETVDDGKYNSLDELPVDKMEEEIAQMDESKVREFLGETAASQ